MIRATIYTDGSCHGNPGPGGYAAIVLQDMKTKAVHGGDWFTTNNRMELMAVIEGLKLLTEPAEVTIITDCQPIVNVITRGNLRAFIKPRHRKNADLWEQILQLSHWHKLSAKWVRGHSGNRLNEKCDRMANMEAERMERETKVRLFTFSELLKNQGIPPEKIAERYPGKCAFSDVQKYYRLFFESICKKAGGSK